MREAVTPQQTTEIESQLEISFSGGGYIIPVTLLKKEIGLPGGRPIS